MAKRIVRTRYQFWIGRIGPKVFPTNLADDPVQDGFVYPFRKGEPYAVREVFAKRKPYTEYVTMNCGLAENIGAVRLNIMIPDVSDVVVTNRGNWSATMGILTGNAGTFDVVYHTVRGVVQIFQVVKTHTAAVSIEPGVSDGWTGYFVLCKTMPQSGPTGTRAVGFYDWMAPVEEGTRLLLDQPNPWFTATRADTGAPVALKGCSRLVWDEIGNGVAHVPGNFVAIGTEDGNYTSVLRTTNERTLPHNPSILLTSIRYATIPPSGSSWHQVVFGTDATTGKGFTLAWGLDVRDPKAPSTIFRGAYLKFPDDTYEMYVLTPEQCVELGTAERQQVAIYVLNGDLVIHLMKINLVWRIPAQRVQRTLPAQQIAIPASGIEWRYSGGFHIANVTAMKFVASGTVTTRPLDHGYPFDLTREAPEGATPVGGSPGTWPSIHESMAGDVAIAVQAHTVYPSTDPRYDPTRIQYTATLTAREDTPGCGWSYWSPTLAMVTAFHLPVEVEPTAPVWYRIDDFVDYGPDAQDGPDGQIQFGSASTLTIPLNLHSKNANGLRWREQLAAWDETLLSGTIACYARYGYEFDDGSVVDYPLITGEISHRVDELPVGEKKTVLLHVVGWGAWLQNQLMWAPCGLGYARVFELWNYALMAGVPLSRTLLDERLQSDDSVVELDTAGLPFADPPLVPPNGTTAQALIDERSAYTHLTCYEDGERLIFALRDPERPEDAEAPTTLYTSTYEHDADVSLTGIGIDADNTATPNRRWREGKTIDGREILIKQDEYNIVGDPTSGRPTPGNPRYRGRIINQVDRDDMHFSQHQIQQFLREDIEWTPRHMRRITLTSKSGEALWDQWILHRVTITDPDHFPYYYAGVWSLVDTIGEGDYPKVYHPQDEVLMGSDLKYYVCTVQHTASNQTAPGSGANWRSVWRPAETFRITTLRFKLTLSRIYTTLTAEER